MAGWIDAVARDVVSFGGVGGLGGREASAWSACLAEVVAAMAALQPARSLAEGRDKTLFPSDHEMVPGTP